MPFTEDELRQLLHERSAATPPRPERFAEIRAGVRRARRVRAAGGAATAAVATAAVVTAVPVLQGATEAGPTLAGPSGPPASPALPSTAPTEQLMPLPLPTVYRDPDGEDPPMRLIGSATIDWPRENSVTLTTKPRGREVEIVAACSKGRSATLLIEESVDGEPAGIASCSRDWAAIVSEVPAGAESVEVGFHARVDKNPVFPTPPSGKTADPGIPPDVPQTIHVGVYERAG